MVETKKEKRLRYLLILLFVSITASAFYYKYNDNPNREENKTPLAVVLEESSGNNENPMVMMYSYQHNEHILALYEIDRNANFRFDTISAVKLEQAPSEIILDKETGVWVEVSDKWNYFNENLQEQLRSKELMGNSTSIPFTIEENEDQWVAIEGLRMIKVDSSENVVQVHSLSKSQDLLLLITESGVKISTFAEN